jgi:hypothetical protein
MVFGKKELDKVCHIRFSFIARLPDPVTVLSAVTVVHIEAKDYERGVAFGQWGLIWAVGVCSTVW